MKYIVEMGSGVLMCIQSFMKSGSGNLKLKYVEDSQTHGHTDGMVIL
jgi:hypothetical protein